jgi:transcriptional regulator with XRE-family HTH domain
MKTLNSNSRYLGKALGLHIAEQRKQKQLTQADLAEKVGIDNVSLSRIETGVVLPSLTRLNALADALEVDVVTFLGASRTPVDLQNQQVQNYLDVLNPSDRLLLLTWIKQFSERFASDALAKT